MHEKDFCFCFIGFVPALFFSFSSLVSVSTPKISVVKRAILGRPFEILCKSDIGSLPINYTLIKDYDHLRTITIKLPDHRAVFTDTITYIDEISKYMCEAKNGHRDGLLSKRLNATVTG